MLRSTFYGHTGSWCGKRSVQLECIDINVKTSCTSCSFWCSPFFSVIVAGSVIFESLTRMDVPQNISTPPSFVSITNLFVAKYIGASFETQFRLIHMISNVRLFTCFQHLLILSGSSIFWLLYTSIQCICNYHIVITCSIPRTSFLWIGIAPFPFISRIFVWFGKIFGRCIKMEMWRQQTVCVVLLMGDLKQLNFVFMFQPHRSTGIYAVIILIWIVTCLMVISWCVRCFHVL